MAPAGSSQACGLSKRVNVTAAPSIWHLAVFPASLAAQSIIAPVVQHPRRRLAPCVCPGVVGSIQSVYYRPCGPTPLQTSSTLCIPRYDETPRIQSYHRHVVRHDQESCPRLLRLPEEKLLRRSVGGGKNLASQAPTGQVYLGPNCSTACSQQKACRRPQGQRSSHFSSQGKNLPSSHYIRPTPSSAPVS